MNIKDPGDKYDKVKWDFKEDMPVFWIDKYPYKATTYERAQILASFRKQINELCKSLKNIKNDRIELFNSIHEERYYNPSFLPYPFYDIAARRHPVSRYLLSEMPHNTNFNGLNKPKMRYLDNDSPPIGKDKQLRALYRDIFIDLDSRKLKELIIHELAHSMCNHVNWRPDDHGEDFELATLIITKHWPK
jgi:hypothetical protein